MARFGRRNRHMTCSNSRINFEDSYITLAYYLSTLLKESKEVNESAIFMVSNLISAAEKEENARALLENTKEKLIRRNLLKRISEEKISKDNRIADTNTPFEFECDSFIDRNYTINPKNSDIQLDLYRVLLAVNFPAISTFIDNLFFNDVFKSDDKKAKAKLNKEINSTKKVQFLIDKVGLTKEEALCILVKFRFSYCSDLYSVIKEYEIDTDEAIMQLLNITKPQYRRMLSRDGKLKSYGFLCEDGDLSEDFIECITTESLDPFFSEYLKPIDCNEAFDIDTFSVPHDTSDIMKNLLMYQDYSSILLYGKPGSGKTEYAKALAKLTGYKTYIFKNENEILAGSNAVARLNCYLSIEQKDTIVIVDEADKLLQTLGMTNLFGMIVPSSTKGTVNQMLENNKNKIIWVINHTSMIDESTKRRFTMSYKFDSMPVSMLTSITKSKLESLNLSSELEEDVLKLFEKYSVTGASVGNIVKTISAFQTQNTSDEVLLKSVKTVLQENSKLLDTRRSKIRENVSSSYDPNIINSSMDANKIVEMVLNAQKFSESNKTTENGIRMLFYGISGSGKTELVRYLAQKLGKKILIKRPSDIMGKYVGQNEANIKEAFEQAAQEDMILLFDEADSFFGDRTQSKNSWEVSTTNEFLTQMEEFPGILVCTTNLKEIMDPAMERRFHIMVEFKPLKKEGITTLLSNYFTSYDFTDSQVNSLAEIGTVTPGDFGSLSSRIRFMNPSDISSSFIVDELTKLQQDKKWEDNSHHSIGFSTN